MSTARALQGAGGAYVATAHLEDGLRGVLGARRGGMREPMLLALITFDDSSFDEDYSRRSDLARELFPLARLAPAVNVANGSSALKKMRQALRNIGASYDAEDRRWSL